jgi:hypothetical protein
MLTLPFYICLLTVANSENLLSNRVASPSARSLSPASATIPVHANESTTGHRHNILKRTSAPGIEVRDGGDTYVIRGKRLWQQMCMPLADIDRQVGKASYLSPFVDSKALGEAGWIEYTRCDNGGLGIEKELAGLGKALRAICAIVRCPPFQKIAWKHNKKTRSPVTGILYQASDTMASEEMKLHG